MLLGGEKTSPLIPSYITNTRNTKRKEHTVTQGKNEGKLKTHHLKTHAAHACSDRCEDTSCVANDHSTPSPLAKYSGLFFSQICGKLICSSLHTGSYMDYGLNVCSLCCMSILVVQGEKQKESTRIQV